MNEDQLTRMCWQWYLAAKPDCFMFHTPNEGRHHISYRVKQKAMGVVSGVPDFTLIFPACTARFVELKVKGNYLSKNQKAVRERLEGLGCGYAVCHTLDEFITVVNNWAAPPKEVRLPTHPAIKMGSMVGI